MNRRSIMLVILLGIVCSLGLAPEEWDRASPSTGDRSTHHVDGSVGSLDSPPTESTIRLPAELPENTLKLTDRLYCGAAPRDQRAFAALASLGINTVVSVDGAVPAVRLAGKHGLRYVHIPIAYDGIDEHAKRSLVRLVRDVQGPIFIHCHHGRHRGPAAAACCCIAAGNMSRNEARRILERAGTSTDYAGLWQSVDTFRVPSDGSQLPPLVAVAPTSTLVSAMSQIDRAFENLKRCRDANWNPIADEPEIVPHQQALLVQEGFYEWQRNRSDELDHALDQWIAQASQHARELTEALRVDNNAIATSKFQRLSRSCQRCHQRYRNE